MKIQRLLLGDLEDFSLFLAPSCVSRWVSFAFIARHAVIYVEIPQCNGKYRYIDAIVLMQPMQ